MYRNCLNLDLHFYSGDSMITIIIAGEFRGGLIVWFLWFEVNTTNISPTNISCPRNSRIANMEGMASICNTMKLSTIRVFVADLLLISSNSFGPVDYNNADWHN